jgi:hypothetical protein
MAAGAVFGRTGRNMEGLPVALGSGAAPTDGTKGHLLQLDDIGATLVQSFGIDPRSHGYTGRVLDFLGMT